MSNIDRIPYNMWWVHRELLRMKMGIYPPPTTALANVCSTHPFQHLMAHISKDDPDQIAFTASADDGLRDRQTRMAFGRFLRKNYHFASDKNIAALEAAHRTELNPPVKFINALEQTEEFVAAYRAISSCMSKGHDSYLSGRSMHPVAAYAAPGWQLAVLESTKDSGFYSARSLVWINPDDPKDKRMVRTYGDVVLHNWLLKSGFAIKSFEGAYLKTKIIAAQKQMDGREGLVCPYVDSGSTVSTNQNSRGVWDGGDRIYLLSTESKLKVPNEFIFSVQHSNGATYGRPFPINRKCAVSGALIDAFKDSYVGVFLNDAHDIALVKHVEGWMQICIKDDHFAYVPPKTVMFKHGMANFLDTAVNRARCGYVKLDAKLYPTEQDWVSSKGSTLVNLNAGITPSARWAKGEDTVQYIVPPSTVRRMHKDELPKDAVRVAAINEHKTWASPACNIVRTEANRAVVPGAHEVVQSWDGQWFYTRHMQRITLLGEKVWIPKDKTLADLGMTTLPHHAITKCEEAVEASAQSSYAKKRALFAVFARQGDMLCPKDELSGGKLSAAYIFEWRDIPLKLVEAWLKADYAEVANAQPNTSQQLHTFGRLVLAKVDELWAVKSTAQPKAAPSAEPVAQAA